jgi:hypothetical protein
MEDGELPVEDFTSLHEGYAKSKWAAEKLVEAAREKGLRTTIFRLGRVTGHSETGVASVEDFMCRFIKGCLQLSAAPDLDWPIDMNPVNIAANIMVSLGTTARAIGKTFHIVHPSPLRLGELYGWISRYGYELAILPYKEWKALLEKSVGAADDGRDSATSKRVESSKIRREENALLPLLPAFGPTRDSMGSIDSMPVFDSSNVQHFISGTDSVDNRTRHPDISGPLLATYFDFYIQCGFLSPPVDHVEVSGGVSNESSNGALRIGGENESVPGPDDEVFIMD